MHNYHVMYLFNSMPGNTIITLWCKDGMVRAMIVMVRDGMVRAIVMVRDGVPTRYALMRHISKGHYISLFVIAILY